MSATKEQLDKILRPTWCFTHSGPVPCEACDATCTTCLGLGGTRGNSCPDCFGSGLAGRWGKQIFHEKSWRKPK